MNLFSSRIWETILKKKVKKWQKRENEITMENYHVKIETEPIQKNKKKVKK